MSNILNRIAAWTLVGTLSSVPVRAGGDGEDWPQFHGPRRDNRSIETGLLKRWPDDGPRLLWTARGIGHGFASVAVVGDRLYTAGDIAGRTIVSALDREGNIVWQQPNGASWENPVPGARGTPTVHEGRLYHESAHGDVLCLDAGTGKRFWELNILERFHAEPPTWGLAESLVLDGTRVICSPGGPETALVALDRHTGGLLWKSPGTGERAGYASPTVVEWNGLRMILTLTARALIGVDAGTGAMLFRFPHETPYEEMILSPVFRDGRVFVSTRSTGSVLLRLDVEPGRVSPVELWRNRDLDNQHRGVVLLGGQIYGCSHVNSDGKWICVDWADGRTRHIERGAGRGSLTWAEGMFYVLGERGEVALVPATPDRHAIVSRFQLPAGAKGPAWAHPVVCRGRLYLRHGDFLRAYAIRAE